MILSVPVYGVFINWRELKDKLTFKKRFKEFLVHHQPQCLELSKSIFDKTKTFLNDYPLLKERNETMLYALINITEIIIEENQDLIKRLILLENLGPHCFECPPCFEEFLTTITNKGIELEVNIF